MQTRQITETLIYKLILNPMRGNTESANIVAISYDKQKLIDWYNNEFAPESYTDEGSPSFECHGDSHPWHKTFKKGSVLEWYNPCSNINEQDHYGQGIGEELVMQEALINPPFFMV